MKTPAKWTDRHRPASLADVVGQGYVVSQLETFVSAPYPTAMIFSGPTGIGKTTLARALAAELGVNMAADWIEVDSGRLDAEAVDWVAGQFRFAPMTPGGWRVILFDEADLMSPAAERRFLSVLESLPSRTVVIFTTNRPEWFEARPRFIDRCEHLRLESRADTLRQDAELLIAQVWHRETGRHDPPRLDDLGTGIIDAEGRISFRRVVAALQAHHADLTGSDPFRLAPPRQKAPARPLLDACRPFGRKPAPVAESIRARVAAARSGQWDAAVLA